MFAKDRIGDKSWDVYEEETLIGTCECGKGKIYDVDLIASHEKVLRIERDYLGKRVRCTNPNCLSKINIDEV
ncbi:hypothetical protein JW813_09385 [Clostridium botulinum]|uniref:hypothetical protein n=1 Tax=Clostridium botulinum TaxID=1491 RepID=UPI00224751AB|nr:hypothetical protein [Clostridium botulinum]UZP01951.1 hypothetical protein JW813_09385 [Clostridium botulinum]UZP05309.1 hypothetical protein JYA71_09655 [Clostridium botulinum]UZP08690.1 hypothetical protein JYA74_09380 [Clostridium botulinum]